MAHESDGMNLRRVGLTLAAVSALAAIGVVVWAAAFRAPAPSGPTAEPLVNPLPGGVGDAEETAAASPEPERLGDLVQSAEDAELQFFDPEDESLRGKMTFARLDPQPNGRFYAERPEAWLLLGNGTSARITAAETNFRMPAGSGEPESGRFTGDVRVEVHRGRLETDEAQSASEAAATFLMDELHFDAALGQVRTTSEVRVLARGVEGSFSGLEAVIDEVGRRLSHLSTRGGGWLERTRVSEAADGGEEDAGAARERDGDAAEDLYLARFDGGVTVEQGASSVRSDQLELWARLVGGGLPEDALGEFLTVSGGGASAGGGDREDDAAGDAPAAIRWEGRLVVRPLDEAPEPLERDALAGRFSSPSTGLVEIVDGASGAEATCASATYGATSRRLTLTGPGSTGVAFRAPETGELVCGRMEIDLTTGRVVMPGAGELRAASPDARAAARTVSWQRGASADLATSGEHVDLSGRWPIERAVFEGGATAREGEAEVTGERLEAVFARVEGGEGTLERVVVEGSARATAPDAGAGRPGRLLGERITVDFRRRGGAGDAGGWSITPTTVLVEGRALAERGLDRGGEGIEAEILRARLGHDPTTDELRVERLEAELDVLVRGAGGEEALAETVTADPLRGVYDLVGEPVTLRRGGAAVTGGSMRIDEIQERLTVFGAGELTHRERGEEAAGYRNVAVAWAGTMVFDGVMERAEFTGDVVVVGEPDELTRDTLRGERIVVDVALGDESSAGAAAAFRRAQVIGEVEERGEGRTAQVETRRFRLDPESESGRRLEFLAYLDGPTLIADAATDTLMAPASGRLLFEDRRGASDGGEIDREGMSTRGTTLFEWEGAARFDRGRGEAVMSRVVRLRQKPLGEDRVTELECERLEAKFAIPRGDGEAEASGGEASLGSRAALGAQLTTARASGAVYARQGDRELIADHLEFDALAGVAQAWANEGNLVTIFDAARAIPLTGSVLRWDLERDRIEWRGAGTTSAPR